MSEQGYYRWPTVAAGRVVFVSEDDLWTVPPSGGVARRLTAGKGEASRPHLSPDGRRIAFTADEDGHPEVYVMDAEGGAPRRLTWLGSQSLVVGWTPQGEIAFTTMAYSPFFRDWRLHAVSPEGGEPRALPWGYGTRIAWAPDGQRVAIGYHAEDLARWKRYRGGRRGVIWVDPRGDGRFRRLFQTEAQTCSPQWLADGRVLFVSDHEGVGNLYTRSPDGGDVQRLTDHAEHYVRWPATDGEVVVYACGGDLRRLDLATGEDVRIEITYRSPGTQPAAKFVDPVRYLQDVDLHPDGRALAAVVRGKPVVLGAWEGPARQLGEVRDGSVRTRIVRYVDDSRLLEVSDATGEAGFAIRTLDTDDVARLDLGDVGRPLEVAVDPTGSRFAFTNHRYQLGVVELNGRSLTWVDRSPAHRISGPAWSACGGWLAWSCPVSSEGARSKIRIRSTADGSITDVTDGRYGDDAPAWDPRGRFLYFLSRREFDPVYDAVYFDLNFTWSQRPYAVTLRADLPSPFRPPPRPLKGEDEGKGTNDAEEGPTDVDLAGIADRIVPFDVPQGRFTRLLGLRDGVLLVEEPVEGSMRVNWRDTGPPPAKRNLKLFDLEEQAYGTLHEGVTDAALDRRGKTLMLRVRNRLRLLPAPRKLPLKPAPKPSEEAGRRSGWVDLKRVSVAVEPRAEWRQMARETWRLMRDHFWNAELSGVDWDAMWDRHAPLLDRIGSRAEYSDLIWCLVGETGTSHCYEMLGDYRPRPSWTVGRLGARLSWDAGAGGYRVDEVVRGEPGDAGRSSPLLAPGVGVSAGQVVTHVNGARVSEDVPPGRLLIDKAGREVSLTVAHAGASRTVSVSLLGDAMPLYYRDWVLANRRRVHAETEGRVGYVHVPDMGATGYSEFHRDYLGEVERDALIVDVRYNRGGHVSQLLIEKLARRIVGWDLNRHGVPYSYPSHAPRGPLVALTNAFAGSDGDIFSHVWKLNRLGPLLGERTWGGVVGIWPRHVHVDGSLTTQPEFAFWFEDVGFGVENYGTEPTEEVVLGPEDQAAGRDPQLAAGIARVLELLADAPPVPPAMRPGS